MKWYMVILERLCKMTISAAIRVQGRGNIHSSNISILGMTFLLGWRFCLNYFSLPVGFDFGMYIGLGKRGEMAKTLMKELFVKLEG